MTIPALPVSPAIIKPRETGLACKLAWICPGLGHIYAGSLVRGLSFGAGSLVPLCLAAVALSIQSSSLAAVVALLVVYLLVWVWSRIDAAAVVRRTRPDYRLKDYNRLSAYVLLTVVPTVAVATAAALAIRTEIGEAIMIPVNFPGLGIYSGDHLTTSRLAYRNRLPERGDLIVYRDSPTNRNLRVGRITALPGETVKTAGGEIALPADTFNVEARGTRLVSSYAVTGKLIFRYWPPNRFGALSRSAAK